ncbi:MAG: DUF4418 family protein [Butyrivibrio sp.]|nr:DUF4418 family protein [Butyrivibrio sp.]
MKSKVIVNVVRVLVFAFLIVGIFTFAHVCGDMGDMEAKCHKTRSFAVAASIVLGALAVVQIFIKKALAEKVTSIVQVAGGIIIALLPIAIAPVCDMKTMHCYVYTRPFLVITGIVLTGIAIVDLLIVLKGKKDGNPA